MIGRAWTSRRPAQCSRRSPTAALTRKGRDRGLMPLSSRRGFASSICRRSAISRWATRTGPSGSSSTARSTTTMPYGSNSRRRVTGSVAARSTEVLSAPVRRTSGRTCLGFARHVHDRGVRLSSRRRLLLARDRFGIKPLYYATTPDWLAFASEVRALRQFFGIDLTIDKQAVRFRRAAVRPGAADDPPWHPGSPPGKSSSMRAYSRTAPS